MRIGVDAREFGGRTTGIARFTANALRGAVDLGRADAIVAFVRPGAPPLPFSAEIREVGGPGPWADLVGLGRSARAARLDVFLSPYYKTPAGLDVPAAAVVHDLIPLDAEGPVRRAYFLQRLRASLRRAARVITVSRHVAAQIRGRLGVPEDRIVVAPNAVGPAFGPAAAAGDEGRIGRLGLAAGSYLLCVSEDKPHKNLATLVEAWRRSDLAAGGLRLAVTARTIRGAPRGASGLLLLGGVGDEDLAALYRCARAAVCPSLDEGFGLPVVEAMACGAPTAAAAAGALPETAGGAALLFDPRSTDAISGALRGIAGDDALRSRLRAEGLARAARFTPAESSRPLWEALDALS